MLEALIAAVRVSTEVVQDNRASGGEMFRKKSPALPGLKSINQVLTGEVLGTG